MPNENIYVASNNSIQQLFYVIGSLLHKPVIVSSEAVKKRVSGNFDLSKPKELLISVAEKTALIWYDDGSSIYIYDANEIQSRVIRLSHAPFDRLVAYLKSTGLYDVRFPPKSNGHSGSFYISGPPVYVELVAAAAKYIDVTYSHASSGETTIRVLKLKNTFVNDRVYTQRGEQKTIPGVATVLNQLLNSPAVGSRQQATIGAASITVDSETRQALENIAPQQTGNYPLLPSFNSAPQGARAKRTLSHHENPINIVAYTDTNSLLIQGSSRQVGFVEDLVNAIDIPKQQIQLSLWILDVSKEDVNELGIRWQGSATVGKTGLRFNTSTLTPTNSLNFLADVSALARKGNAQVVSRPEILTQENVPALFDNNSSFYARLVGERTSSLEKVTYGTMISVLPRLANRSKEIEMILNINDGTLPVNSDGKTVLVDTLPVVNNTQISTGARVPMGYSLLVGGYTRKQDEYHSIGIPLLKDIPLVGKWLFDYSYTSHKDMIRLFLIQPRVLSHGETWQGKLSENPELGKNISGDQVTLKSTVSMLQQYMKQN
ncbi:type III secretion system outer membrane ring subunit SctC [Pantoea sp. LMR881]|uniref:type III secretion system outer membrane ring subunit SctC n=1 Tax=Pantoea sp. LMR881 TaxID=3014336 RepID=UPI0022AFDE79|nr:type III secretion system outer membrane ring subunit SctC [Pantoea sp. LMR881]MCZ4057958.1 type III secretion system outer membrane ring subunit SctC [Pantoea sp. LMR881]